MNPIIEKGINLAGEAVLPLYKNDLAYAMLQRIGTGMQFAEGGGDNPDGLPVPTDIENEIPNLIQVDSPLKFTLSILGGIAVLAFGTLYLRNIHPESNESHRPYDDL